MSKKTAAKGYEQEHFCIWPYAWVIHFQEKLKGLNSIQLKSSGTQFNEML